MQNLPTIQPIENRDFHYIAATYGMRMHPFYKVLKMHTGIDFSSPLGASVYAAADGRVSNVELTIIISTKLRLPSIKR